MEVEMRLLHTLSAVLLLTCISSLHPGIPAQWIFGCPVARAFQKVLRNPIREKRNRFIFMVIYKE